MTFNVTGSGINNGVYTYTARIGNGYNTNPFMLGSLFNMGNLNFNTGYDFTSAINLSMMLPYLMMQNMPMINTDHFDFSGLRLNIPQQSCGCGCQAKAKEESKKTEETKETKETEKDNNTKKAEESKKAEETEAAAKIKENAADIAGEIFDATDGAFKTDENKLMKAVNKINKDNVLEVMDAWERLYSDVGDASLLDQIRNDTSDYGNGDLGDLETTIERKIKDALCERAKAVGLGEEARAVHHKVEKEFKPAWYSWVSRGKIASNLNDLAEKIREAESNKKREKAETVGTQEDDYGKEDMSSCMMTPYGPTCFNYIG